ncbi:hypothetical protein QAD02_004475 [Eretmocerus hayati]|uniref:Uncharacterized protein n=1 Tax=Eretmocerus hayati TaxID=131215 RepID=A0ACC2NQR5_9HYME|nr:hypothetical protein QAD02_004475 [Eretmocerus hayati]
MPETRCAVDSGDAALRYDQSREYPLISGDVDVGMIDPSSVEKNLVDMISEKSKLEPYLEIIEQPSSRAHRYRYECEGRYAGCIPGVNSSPLKKTFPTIKIHNYTGKVLVRISCVTETYPYKPHPHKLVGYGGSLEGVCLMTVPTDTMTLSFDKLGIQCVKRVAVKNSLNLREKQGIDPFKTGFGHKDKPKLIKLNMLRLCFEAFLQKSSTQDYRYPLPPVVSDLIYDKKATFDLNICKLSHYSVPVTGGTNVMLFCEKITKDDIKIRFYEERHGRLIWEGFGDFQPTDVHHQVAIHFRTPSYITHEIDEPVLVKIQLFRPSDRATSKPLPFEFQPIGLPGYRRRKMAKPNNFGLETPLHERTEAKIHPNQVGAVPTYNFVNIDSSFAVNVNNCDQNVPRPNIAMTNEVFNNIPDDHQKNLAHPIQPIQIQDPSFMNDVQNWNTDSKQGSNDVFNLINVDHQQNLAQRLQPTYVQIHGSSFMNEVQNWNIDVNQNNLTEPSSENIIFDDINSVSNTIGDAISLCDLQNIGNIAGVNFNFESMEALVLSN